MVAGNNSFHTFIQNLERMLTKKHGVRLAIDGNCAAGKSTLAAWLKEKYGATVLHVDDYFLQPFQRTAERMAEPGGNFDRERFLSEVGTGLLSAKSFEVRSFDCKTMTLGEKKIIEVCNFYIIEGAYSHHPELQALWSLKVFVGLPFEEQSKRIMTRNGPMLHKKFVDQWIPLEEEYFDKFKIEENSDYILDGLELMTHYVEKPEG